MTDLPLDVFALLDFHEPTTVETLWHDLQVLKRPASEAEIEQCLRGMPNAELKDGGWVRKPEVIGAEPVKGKKELQGTFF